MRWLFDIHNPVMRWIVKIFDCMCLSALWVIVSLPIFTIGASTTALFATIHHYIRRDEDGLWGTFWRSFREEFKRSTLCWLVAMLVLILLGVDALVFRTMAIRGEWLGKLYFVILLLIAVVATWIAYLFSYAQQFTGSVKDVLRLSFMLMILHPIKSITVLLILFAGTAMVVLQPGFLMIVPAVTCWLCDVVIDSVFALHLREEDRTQWEETHDSQKTEG